MPDPTVFVPPRPNRLSYIVLRLSNDADLRPRPHPLQALDTGGRIWFCMG